MLNRSPGFFILFLFFSFVCRFEAESQTTNDKKDHFDDLYHLAQTASAPDSVRIQAYLDLADGLQLNSDETYMKFDAEFYFNQALKFASSKGMIKFFLSAVDSKGVVYRNVANYSSSLEWHKRELKVNDSLNLIQEKIVALNNLGVVHRRIDDYKQGSEYHLQALKLAEEIKDTKGITIATNGLGNIQYLLGNYDDAMRLFRECLRIEQSINHLLGVAINLNNLGNVYKKVGNYEKALEYYMLSLEVNREIGSQIGVAICYNDIGSLYRDKKDYNKALNYCLLGLELNKSMNDLNYLANSQIMVAQLYIDKKDYQNAIKYLEEAIKISTKTQSKANTKDAYTLMYKVSKTLNQTENALNYLERSQELNDSILNDNTRKSILQMQTLFDRERSENQITLLKKQREISDLSSKRQRFITIIISIIMIGMLLALTVVIYVIYLRTKANRELQHKNQEIENTQAELKVYAEQMKLAKEDAIRSNQLKSQFLANMSHEIRTPMNSVIGFTDILAMSITDPVQQSYLESIRASGKNLLTLINDILDLSKIEAGKMVVDKGPSRIRPLFEEIRNIFSLQIKEKKIQFNVHLESNIPDLVYLSEIRLRQILFNLIGNAIKFTNNGEVGMLVFIENFTSNNSFDLHFKISDTGVGISETNQNRIFEAFYQEPGLNTSGKGTGLGLTITKRLIEAMNGTINFESKEGQGTTFRIIFRDVASEVFNPVASSSIQKVAIEVKNPVFFLLLSNKKTENLLVDIMSEYNLQLHSFYETGQLFSLMNQIKPDCLIIETGKFDLDFLADFIMNNLSSSTRVFIIQDKESEEITSRLSQYPKFNIPEQILDLQNYIKAIASIKADKIAGLRSITSSVSTLESRGSINELTRLWKQALKTQFMDDTELFADQLIDFAQNSGNTILFDYGNELKNHVTAFDIEKINSSMEEFEQIIRKSGFKSSF
jgi:signal transduction histidine kinase